MNRNLLVLAALVLLPACASLPADQIDPEESTGEMMTGMASSAGSSTGEVAEGSSSTSTSTSAGDTSSTGSSSTSTSTSTGEENSSSGSSSSSTGEGSSSSSTSDLGRVCGDGVEDLYENCDDGNDIGGDGCSADCKRWDWSGVAKDVPEADLIQWLPCWSSLYSENALVGEILKACTGPQMMLACRPVGSETFTVMAHAQRAEILAPLDPMSTDPWTVINGSAWQWSTDQIAVFDSSKPWQSKCLGSLCWPRIGDSILQGGRCGDLAMGLEDQPGWERVVLQSFY